jgi:hypothetical protein
MGQRAVCWHPWRRRYDLFVRDAPRRVLQSVSSPDPEASEDGYSQVAEIDAGLLAWHFAFAGASGAERASVSRRWGGLGREVFTDTGAYYVRFGPAPVVDDSGHVVPQRGAEEMTLEERALALATAVTIDYDYFSRHSSGCVQLSGVGGRRTDAGTMVVEGSAWWRCLRCSSEVCLAVYGRQVRAVDVAQGGGRVYLA